MSTQVAANEPATLTEAILGKELISAPIFSKLRAWPAELRAALFSVLLASTVLLPFLGAVGLWDPWEVHYGEVAREMIQRNDYVHPFWENAWFFSKPAFTMWMQALGLQAAELGPLLALVLAALLGGLGFALYTGKLKGASATKEFWGVLGLLFGAFFLVLFVWAKVITLPWRFSTPAAGPDALPLFTEWGFRLPFAGFSILAIGLLAYAMTIAVNARAALATSVVLVTMPLYFLLSRQAVTDTPIISATIAGIACAMVGLFDKTSRFRSEWWYGAYVFFAIATLAKGLLGFGVPMLVWFAYAFLRHGSTQWLTTNVRLKPNEKLASLGIWGLSAAVGFTLLWVVVGRLMAPAMNAVGPTADYVGAIFSGDYTRFAEPMATGATIARFREVYQGFLALTILGALIWLESIAIRVRMDLRVEPNAGLTSIGDIAFPVAVGFATLMLAVPYVLSPEYRILRGLFLLVAGGAAATWAVTFLLRIIGSKLWVRHLVFPMGVGLGAAAMAGLVAYLIGARWNTTFMAVPVVDNVSLISAPVWLGIMWGSLAFWAVTTVLIGMNETAKAEPPPSLIALAWNMRLGTGLLLFLAVCLPWYYEMFTFWRLDDESKIFWFRFIIHDHFARLGSGVHTTTPGGDFTYFILQGGYAMFPWVAIVPGALATAGRLKIRGLTGADGLGLIAVLWFVITWALIGSSATKFHHYTAPMLPPLAILMGLFLDKLWEEGIDSHGLVLLFGVPLFILVGKDLAATPKNFTDLFVYNYDRPYPTFLTETAVLGSYNIKQLMGMGMALAGVTIGTFAILRSRAMMFTAGLASVMVFALWFNWSHWVQLSHQWTQRDQFWRYYTQRRPNEPIAAFLMNWRGETFYSRNTVKQIKDNPQVGMKSYADQPGREWSLVEHARLPMLKSAVGDKPLTLVDKDLNNKFVLVIIGE